MSIETVQPPIGGICESCGHFAGRHGETGCRFARPADNPCTCEGMTWRGNVWPRPWLPAPDGLTADPTPNGDPA